MRLHRSFAVRARVALYWALALPLSLVWFGAASRDASAPPTAVHDVSDTFFDVTVTDPYRWLEDAANPEVHAWSVSEDQRTRRYLDGLPFRKPMFDRLLRQAKATSPAYFELQPAGGRIFARYRQPAKQQTMIAVLPLSADPGSARVVVDPNQLNPKGTTAIDWFVASPNGRLVAVSLSENGSEDGTLHVFDVASGKQLPDVITRAQYPTGGGSLAWRADSTGFWYTRYPAPDRPAEEQHFFQKLYYHALGQDPQADALVLGDLPKVAEIALSNQHNTDVLLVTVANGDGGEFAHYLVDARSGAIRQFTHFEDQVYFATVATDGSIYMLSHDKAPRGRMLKTSIADPSVANAQPLIPESEAVLEGATQGLSSDPILPTAHALYVRELVGGPSRVAIFGFDGSAHGQLPLPDPAANEEMAALPDGVLLYDVATYLRPFHFVRYDEMTGKSSETRLAVQSPVSFKDAEVVRVMATSRDGTQVPLNIIRRKNTPLNGRNPVLLTGYGGYGVSMKPYFVGASGRLWLDGGGIFVETNLRGGGEFGQAWHEAGNLTHKQNVFDDFIGASNYLINEKYTSPEHLAILGGSNGGLLMGAVLTQQPQLYRAVVSEVGIYDMLRVELDPNGAFNVTEFGTVKNEEQFRALFAYSPYHHVVEGTKYPAVLFITGETDGRVNPMNSRKMTARLQAATTGGPIYLSTNSHAGHGIGSSLSIRVGQQADLDAFLFDQLGMRLPAH